MPAPPSTPTSLEAALELTWNERGFEARIPTKMRRPYRPVPPLTIALLAACALCVSLASDHAAPAWLVVGAAPLFALLMGGDAVTAPLRSTLLVVHSEALVVDLHARTLRLGAHTTPLAEVVEVRLDGPVLRVTRRGLPDLTVCASAELPPETLQPVALALRQSVMALRQEQPPIRRYHAGPAMQLPRRASTGRWARPED
ncbi:MAG: hypothetical protein KTR31_08925 [Myxococcales bacterium]|nr:hypothetical protein [Myxococcales bacterium]